MLSRDEIITLFVTLEACGMPDAYALAERLLDELDALKALAEWLAGIVQDASTEKHHDLVCSHRPECWYCKEINDSLAAAKALLGVTP